MGRARRHHPPSGGLFPIPASARAFRAAQAAQGPQREQHHQHHAGRVGEADLRRVAREEAAPGLDDPRHRVDDRDAVNPALQQRQRHVDRREEEHHEDGELHHRAGLHRPEAHRDAGGPEHGREVQQHGERVEPDQVAPAPPDVHPDGQRDDRQHRRRDHPAAEGRQRVAKDDPDPVRGRQQQPPRKAALEVARDPEAGEDAAEGGRLQQHEDELEGGVAARVGEARHVADVREPAREGGEEEEREDERGQQQRRVREHVVQRPPRDALGDRERPHPRAIRTRSAQLEAAMATTATAVAIPKPSASASPSQPVMIMLRTHSSRYETGLAVAASRNHVASIRFRGMFIDEMKRKTKKAGKRLCTASPEPVRSAAKAPSAPKARPTRAANANSTSTPAGPAAIRTPTAIPTPRYTAAWTRLSTTTPPSWPQSSAIPRIGVSESRFRKPVWMSRARSVPVFMVANSAPWMNGTASAKATKEFVGKPGRFVAAFSPPEFTASSSIGKSNGATTFAGWRTVRTTERRPRR